MFSTRNALVVACLLKCALAERDSTREEALKLFYYEMELTHGTGLYCDEGELVGNKCLIGTRRDADKDCGERTFQDGQCAINDQKPKSIGCSAKIYRGKSIANYCDTTKASALKAEGVRCDFLYRQDNNSCTLVDTPAPIFMCLGYSWREGVTSTDRKGYCIKPDVQRPGGSCTSPWENSGHGKCTKTVEEVEATMACPGGFNPEGALCKKTDGSGKTKALVPTCSSPAFRLSEKEKKCRRYEIGAEKPSCVEGQGVADGRGFCYKESRVAVTADCMGGTVNADETQCSIAVSSTEEYGCRDGYAELKTQCDKYVGTDATFTCNGTERLITYAGYDFKHPLCIAVEREVDAKEN